MRIRLNTNPFDLYKPVILNQIQERVRILEEDGLQEDTEQLRTVEVYIYLDNSGSMVINEEDVYNAVQTTLLSLEKQNKASLTFCYRVKIMTFNDSVREFNSTALPPAQLAELFRPEHYRCKGSTNLSAMLDHMDKQFSHTSSLVTGRKKGDYKVIMVTITDFAGTDDPAARKRALDRINSNRFAKQMVDQICVFVGSEADKKEAILLAGSEDNIIALCQNLSECLAPTMINTTITTVESTHMDTDQDNKTPASLGKEALERQAEGSKTADLFAKKSLSQKIDELLGG